jgi:hypothetical protein
MGGVLLPLPRLSLWCVAYLRTRTALHALQVLITNVSVKLNTNITI